jgi:HTH-type transcriptional regulator, sugar sensing transcriptional regulator
MAGTEQLLAELGFGEYESRAYLALLSHGPANGYELAKLSGIPRGNIYGVLQKLEDRGAVVHMDTAGGARFSALPVAELVAGLERRYKQTLAAAAKQLSAVAAPPHIDHVWNLNGYDAILEHGRSLLAQATGSVLIAVWPPEAHALAAELDMAHRRGLGIATLCLTGCPHECSACRGSIHRHQLADSDSVRTVVIVSANDRGGELVAGEIMPTRPGVVAAPAARGIRTRQLLLVDLAASYIRHSVALAALLADPQIGAAQLLPETRRALALLAQDSPAEGWLTTLQHVLAAGDKLVSPNAIPEILGD